MAPEVVCGLYTPEEFGDFDAELPAPKNGNGKSRPVKSEAVATTPPPVADADLVTPPALP